MFRNDAEDFTIRWLDSHTLFVETQAPRRLGNGRCIDVRTGAQRGKVLYGNVYGLNCIQPSPDGRWLLLDSDAHNSDTADPIAPRLVRVSDGKSIALPVQHHRDDAVVYYGTWLTADRLVAFQNNPGSPIRVDLTAWWRSPVRVGGYALCPSSSAGRRSTLADR